MRNWWIAGLVISGVAAAAPGTITIKVQKARLHDVASKLSEQSGCRVSGFGATAQIDLDLRNATLWDALAKLETDHGVESRFSHGQIMLDVKGSNMMGRGFNVIDPNPSWIRHWRGSGPWAVALLGDGVDTRARLVILGQDGGTIDKVVVDKATSGGKQLKVVPGLPISTNPCEPAAIVLDLDSVPKKTSMRGHVVIKIPKMIEKRVAVPLDDGVVDIAEGRLRIHISSKADRQSMRRVHVGWDSMGDPVKVSVSLLDEQNAPLKASGRGSGTGGSMGHEDFTVAVNATTKIFAIIRLPGTKTIEEKIPFKFENETLDRPGP